VAGVTVKTGVFSFEEARGADSGQLAQVLTWVRAEAVLVDEKVVAEDWQVVEGGGGYRLGLTLRGRVVDRRQRTDSDFEVTVRLDRDRLFEGEFATATMQSTRAVRLYLLGLSELGAVVLVPNAWQPDTRVPAGRVLVFPGDELSARGVRLQARLPEGRREARETLLVLALRGDRDLPVLRPSGDRVFREEDSRNVGRLLGDLLGPLADLPPDEWAMDAVTYEVVGR
jgi:hypothetical protein